MTNHLRLDLDLVELLAGVDTNDTANHLGDDNHVSEVGLDEVGLLVGLSLLLSLSELLDETHGAALQATVDPAAGTSVDNIAKLVGGEVEEPVEWRKIKHQHGFRSLGGASSQVFIFQQSRRRNRAVATY